MQKKCSTGGRAAVASPKEGPTISPRTFDAAEAVANAIANAVYLAPHVATTAAVANCLLDQIPERTTVLMRETDEILRQADEAGAGSGERRTKARTRD